MPTLVAMPPVFIQLGKVAFPRKIEGGAAIEGSLEVPEARVDPADSARRREFCLILAKGY